jgi:hypothetical protein
MKMIRNFLWFAISATMLLSVSAFADTEKLISQKIDASELKSVRLEFPVGELSIETYDGHEIQLEIDIEAKRRWFSGKRDVDDIELDVQISGSRAYLEIDEKKIEQHWRVRIPASLALEIDVGVGEIQVESFVNTLEVEMGVGSVEVEVAGNSYDSIHVSSGVGDATINGFEEPASNERNFISAESLYRGDGDMEIEIEVGVGDIEVNSS